MRDTDFIRFRNRIRSHLSRPGCVTIHLLAGRSTAWTFEGEQHVAERGYSTRKIPSSASSNVECRSNQAIRDPSADENITAAPLVVLLYSRSHPCSGSPQNAAHPRKISTASPGRLRERDSSLPRLQCRIKAALLRCIYTDIKALCCCNGPAPDMLYL